MHEFKFVTAYAMVDADGEPTADKRQAAEVYQAEARMELLRGNQEPYFAITCDGYDRHARRGEARINVNGRNFWMASCGCQHDTVARLFPKLATMIKWHLVSPSGPMHYAANGVYCWEQWRKAWQGTPDESDTRYTPEGYDVTAELERRFKQSVLFGTVPSDARYTLESWDKPESVQAWLDTRIHHIREQFARDMETLAANPVMFDLMP